MDTKALLDQDDLLTATGFCRAGDLRRFLDTNRIPYMQGKGGRVFTSVEAVNQVLIGKDDDSDSDFEFI